MSHFPRSLGLAPPSLSGSRAFAQGPCLWHPVVARSQARLCPWAPARGERTDDSPPQVAAGTLQDGAFYDGSALGLLTRSETSCNH